MKGLAGESVRLRITVRGAVQGVGYRPFLHRLATGLGLKGWAQNGPDGIVCEVEGDPDAVAAFLGRASLERPPRAVVEGFEHAFLDPSGYGSFEIRESRTESDPTVLVLPDIAPCAPCLAELSDPGDRRFRYPFANCTHCGPRYTIVESLPYDRERTTLKGFPLCGACRREYGDPADRRFHAQPIACPACGPRLELVDPAGRALAAGDLALRGALRALGEGAVVAVKGVGGFHLMADARSESAVDTLRRRKGRGEKPFALLVRSLEAAREIARVTALEEALLVSPEAPIVLVRRAGVPVAASVAPGNPNLGLLLPPSPLHHLLARGAPGPLVATSGNRSEEPLATENGQALERLAGIADLFLVHDRPIARPVDDSIVRIVAGRPLVLRRARGYVPLPIASARPLRPVLAVGPELKGTVALARGRHLFLSQHLGDLGSPAAFDNFRRTVEDLRSLLAVRPEAAVHDLHPDYGSTRYAETLALPKVPVQHHLAHVLSCMSDNEIEPPVLGVAWDGAGLGPDGTSWGGEFLRVTASTCERVGHFRPYPLPGGDRAAREPRRAALGLLFAIWGRGLPRDLPPVRAFRPEELDRLLEMLARDVRCPRTSSAGRLFDAAAGLLGLRAQSTFEGQAAMEVEFAAERAGAFEPYAGAGEDWEGLVREMVRDVGAGLPAPAIAARFHGTLVEALVGVARRVGEERVVLTGGCFQNRLLTELAVARLRGEGFRPYWHQRVPPNDGGIALGQAVAGGRPCA